MADKTKLELQIEQAAKRIQEEQKRLKLLQNQQKEQDRKARNHRLCKRHGFLESILPDIITLTDEQFEKFVKQHIANRHGIAALATLTGQTAQSNTTTSTAAPTDTTSQNGSGNKQQHSGHNNGIHAANSTAHSGGSGKPQTATA